MRAGSNRKAIIIGGGIGGLCAAIALRKKGIAATVFERVPELKEVGAGLSLWANAIKALDRIGMAEAVGAISIPQTIGGVRSIEGNLLSSALRGHAESRIGETLVVVLHRAELLSALLQKAGEENVITGAKCLGFEQDDQGVTAQFAGGQEVRGDLLLGADGINSIVRAQLFGKSAPRYSGYTGWRAVTEFDHPILRQGAFESWGKGVRFGMIPLSRKRIYWFAAKNAPQGESNSAGDGKGELLRLFRGWHEPIEAAIEATDENAILRNDIVDRIPLKKWTQGRVTLLGDAAHPMTPNLGQGACQAIEDAVVLADCLSENSALTEALKTYEARRLERANRIVRQSWRIGKAIQLENTLVCKLRNAIMKLTPAALQMKQLEWIIGYEV
jgi:2-polyprenyl-6-methoxyphenol hydroxylase-like FAD-dependent oxidoreductase